MKEHEIVSAVAQSTGIDDHELAHRAVTATLSTLGSRLAGGETKDVASRLPTALAEVMPATGPGERFDVDEFHRRVAEAGGCTDAQARQHAHGVLAALEVALTGNEFEQMAAQLPPDYTDLLGTGPVHHH